VQHIYNRKNDGKAQILLIWVDEYEIMYKRKELCQIIHDKFKDSTFINIALFTFLDRKDLFFQSHSFTTIK